MKNSDLQSLADALKDFAPPTKKKSYSQEERRLVVGFEEVQDFVKRSGRLPRDLEEADIFERLYAVRLKQLQKHPKFEELILPLDSQGIFDPEKEWEEEGLEEISVEDLASALEAFGAPELTNLRHVRSTAARKAAEEIARREACVDFEDFAPVFEQVRRELDSGVRTTIPYEEFARVRQGDFFILGGQLVYVAEYGEEFLLDDGRTDARLRVIYDNKTQSNLLRRSLQRALSQDSTARRLTNPDLGPLFSNELSEGDVLSGTIYVLRSLSDHEIIRENRELIHKIGVTTQEVKTRIANAADQATYLLADVEVVAEYDLANIQPKKLEAVIHKVLGPAQLDITIEDRFGKPVQPREWFFVPLYVIQEIIERIQDGSITEYRYNPATVELER